MIYITGDLHGAQNLYRFDSEHFLAGNNLTKDDYLIILGDFGIPWSNSIFDDYEYEIKRLKWLNSRPFTTVFIDGNHENFVNLNNFEETEMFGAKVHQLDDSIYHLMRGNIYTIENKKFFAFGGALSIDKSYRIPYQSWWPQELPLQEEIDNAFKTLEKNDYKVDYILTHTVCQKMVSKLFNKDTMCHIEDPTQKFLDIIYDKVKFKKWFFGHFHFNRVIDNKFFALYENILELKK